MYHIFLQSTEVWNEFFRTFVCGEMLLLEGGEHVLCHVYLFWCKWVVVKYVMFIVWHVAVNLQDIPVFSIVSHLRDIKCVRVIYHGELIDG